MNDSRWLMDDDYFILLEYHQWCKPCALKLKDQPTTPRIDQHLQATLTQGFRVEGLCRSQFFHVDRIQPSDELNDRIANVHFTEIAEVVRANQKRTRSPHWVKVKVTWREKRLIIAKGKDKTLTIRWWHPIKYTRCHNQPRQQSVNHIRTKPLGKT